MFGMTFSEGNEIACDLEMSLTMTIPRFKINYIKPQRHGRTDDDKNPEGKSFFYSTFSK